MTSKAWTPSGVQTGNEGEVARMQSKKSDLTNMKVGSYSRRKDALGDLCGNFLVALKWTDTCHMHFFFKGTVDDFAFTSFITDLVAFDHTIRSC